MMFSVTYCDNGTIVAVGDKGASIIKESSSQKTDYSYEGQQLCSYTVDTGRTVLALSPYENSTQCKLTVLDNTGKATTSINVNGRIKSVTLFSDTVAALAGDKVYAFSAASGRSIGTCNAGGDATAIALHNESSAYVLGVSEIRLATIK